MRGRRRRAPAAVLLAGAMLVAALAIVATGSAAGGQKLTLRADPDGALEFTKRTVNAKPGKATFTFINPSGSGVPHALEVEGKGIEKKTPRLGPGKKASFSVRLKAGRYTFYCPVDGHRAAGMKGKVVVKR
jgi:plastocyanin